MLRLSGFRVGFVDGRTVNSEWDVKLGRIWDASASWRFRIISGIGTPVTYALAQNGLASRHGTQPLQIMRNQQLDHLGKAIILNV